MNRLSPKPHEIVAAFHQNTMRPTQAQLNALAARRITPWALAGAPGTGEHAVGFCRVTPNGCRCDFSDDGLPSMAVVALDDEGEPADIVAWALRSAWVGTWFGRLSFLGAQNLFGPRMESDALTLHPDPWSWLRDERRGVVLVNTRRAARELQDRGPFIAAGGPEHAEALAALLTMPAPVILVPLPDEERRAA